MSFMAAAVAGSAVVGAAASNSAAGKQKDAAAQATAQQKQSYDQQAALQEPFRRSGVEANNQLALMMGLTSPDMYAKAESEYLNDIRQRFPHLSENWKPYETDVRAYMSANQDRFGPDTSNPANGSLMKNFGMEDFEADPGYQFRMDEGMRGVEGGAAARGGLLSGATLKAIQKYGQGLASQEYGNSYNRFTNDQTNQYNRLAGIVNSGQGATNQVGNATLNFGNQAAGNTIGAGNAAASGIMGGANAIAGGINQGANMYQSNQLMDQYKNRTNVLAQIAKPGVNFGTATGADMSLYY